MMAIHSRSEPGARRDEARAALAFIALVAVAQLVFLTAGCDWDLCGDEAEYWSWSRKLDWSYYAKGPLIAFLIRFATTVAGGASLALTGSLMPAVRLPAVLLGGLTAWGVYRLTAETCRSARAGLLSVLILPAVPLFRAGGLVMTIDTPLVCCWAWAAVWSYRGLVRGELRAWIAAGALVALGVTAKYTMLAFPASVGLFLLATREGRREWLRPGFWCLALGCALGMAPILYWNARHGWVAADQMSDRLGFNSSWNWGRVMPLLRFLAGELAVLGVWSVFGVLALGHAMASVRRDSDCRPGWLYLLCLWVVVWSACVAAACLGETEANWSAPAQVALVSLVAAWLEPRLTAPGRSRAAWVYVGAWVLGIVGLSALQHAEQFYRLLPARLVAAAPRRPAPLRLWEPTCRLRGYRELAPKVAARLTELRAEGLDPFVLAPTPTLAATLSFYLPGQPDVYCVAWSPGLAAHALNQHDLWRPNPRHDIGAFRGRPVVIVEDATRPKSYARSAIGLGAVAEAEPSERFIVRRGDVPVAAWDVTVCRDYLGPQRVDAYRALLRRFATPEYYVAQGGTPRGFVCGVCRDLLGRAPTDRELARWSRLLQGQPRGLLVTTLARRDEYRERHPRR